jgi:hypothetical protein
MENGPVLFSGNTTENSGVAAIKIGGMDAELNERQEVKSRRCLFSYRSQVRNIQPNAHTKLIRSLNSAFVHIAVKPGVH